MLYLHYRRSGGLAGVELAAEVHGDELRSEHATAVAELLAHGVGSPQRTTPPGVPADQFSHELHVDDGTHERTFHWTDAEVPESLRPLIAELNHRATPVRHR